jgi:hypothetical protein
MPHKPDEVPETVESINAGLRVREYRSGYPVFNCRRRIQAGSRRHSSVDEPDVKRHRYPSDEAAGLGWASDSRLESWRGL